MKIEHSEWHSTFEYDPHTFCLSVRDVFCAWAISLSVLLMLSLL